MHYCLLIHEDAASFTARTDPARRDAYWAGVGAYVTAIRESGILIAGAGLEPPHTATSLHHGGDGPRVQDGPYAEVKDQLGGFFLIAVPDRQTALDWAARFPLLPGQGIEVRPTLPEG